MTQDTPIERHVLQDGDVRIAVLSMGCAVQDWQVGDTHVVLGYANPEDYRTNPVAMGTVCGRVVNRIRNARFDIDGTTYRLPANSGPNHIHGGPGGLGLSNWQMDRDGARAVLLRHHSTDLDQGYPGAVDFSVEMRLDGHRLTYIMTGTPSQKTPINLAQHIYFNLMGNGTVRDHVLRIDADTYTPNAADNMPMGRIDPVDGTRYDFRTPKRLEDADQERAGWDGNLLLNQTTQPKAEVTAPNGMRLRLWSQERGLQLYTSNTLGPHGSPLPGPPHAPFAGICLEAQGMPVAFGTDALEQSLCEPGRDYFQKLEIEIAPDA
ncbi:aldose epimerase family protein [Puniceibacterium sp. IMCC21224]|uniref:aldose epimerase family protein n=1 Tax=Puniceibacterium sp. IMCC21224 TaxID=1618204 RepID=UPI00065D4CC3|nr:aldose epimerase family protein [Puniceibacterium sp. IMCC21224]KMK65894.1 aldose 1-epimerase [Puniceibacterium sp. IMCC21224]